MECFSLRCTSLSPAPRPIAGLITVLESVFLFRSVSTSPLSIVLLVMQVEHDENLGKLQVITCCSSVYRYDKVHIRLIFHAAQERCNNSLSSTAFHHLNIKVVLYFVIIELLFILL